MARTATATAQPRSRSKSPYGVHPGVAMMQDWVATLRDKTGRSLDEWIELVKREGPRDEARQRDWLKLKYKLGTNSCWWIVERVAGRGAEDADPQSYLAAAEQWVKQMHAGKKAALRPIYDALLKLSLGIAKDVKACPCKTMVPIYRNHVIAQIKPSTNSRIDFGLALGNAKAPKRLINTGGYEKKDRITHRIEISSLDDIDAEVERWLRKAYEMDD
jgi:hypothetical protein